MTKALGMQVFFNFNPLNYGPTVEAGGNPYTDCWQEVCATAVDGGGVEANIEDLEPCLKDLIINQFPGDVKYSQQTIDYKIDFGDPNADVSTVSGNTYNKLEYCCVNRLKIKYCIAIPTFPAPVYAERYAYIASQTEMSKERNQDMKAQVILVPCPVVSGEAAVGGGNPQTEAFLYSVTAPTPICGA